MADLTADEVHVWVARLEAAPEEADRLLATLADEEKQRAARFRTDRLRERFIASRAAQRAILARYVEVAPDAIAYRYTRYGKPSLEPGIDTSIRFNVTNSEDRALIAVARDREVGVDVEAERRIRDAAALARRFFSEAEHHALQRISAGELERAFLACWTRKEAYVKATGLGITMQLAGFDVNVEPDAPPALLSTRPDPADAERWSMHALDVGAGYVATLVVEGAISTVRLFEWPEVS